MNRQTLTIMLLVLLAACGTKKQPVKSVVANSKPIAEAKASNDSTQIAAKDAEIARLTHENDSLKQAIRNYEAVFASTEKTISDIYEANREKAVSELDLEKLDEAAAVFTSMKPLLQTNPALCATIEGKMGEMESWKSLRQVLGEATAYMEGKYNNATRKQCLKAVNDVMKSTNLSNAQRGELQQVADALENQAEVQQKCLALTTYLTEETILLRTSKDVTEVMAEITKTQNALQGKLSPYHVKHNEALAALQTMFEEAANDISKDKLNTVNGFEKAVNHVKSIFQ